MVSQNSGRKSSSQSPSDNRVGLVASRRDSCSTLLMMVLTRSELLRMMSVSRRSSGRDVRTFGEQLAGVAHGADGIAYFMRDAGGKPAERRELALLHALGHEARVLEENQGGARRPRRAARNAAESSARRPPPRTSRARRPAVRPAARCSTNRAGAARPRPPSAPGTACVSPRISAADSLMRRILSAASTTRRLSRRCCTMYCDSSARFARSTSFWRTRSSLSRMRLATTLAEAATVNSTTPRKPAVAYAVMSAWPLSCCQIVCSEHGEGGDRGQEQRAARRQQERQAAHRNQQQQPQAARNAAAGMQQQHQARDVDRRLQNGLNPGARQAPAHQDDAAQAEAQIEDRDGEEQLRRVDGDAARSPQGIKAEEHQRHQHPVQIEQPEHAPIEGDLGADVAVDRAVQECSRY